MLEKRCAGGGRLRHLAPQSPHPPSPPRPLLPHPAASHLGSSPTLPQGWRILCGCLHAGDMARTWFTVGRWFMPQARDKASYDNTSSIGADIEKLDNMLCKRGMEQV